MPDTFKFELPVPEWFDDRADCSTFMGVPIIIHPEHPPHILRDGVWVEIECFPEEQEPRPCACRFIGDRPVVTCAYHEDIERRCKELEDKNKELIDKHAKTHNDALLEQNKKKVTEWLFSDDTGLSSLALASEYLGVDNRRQHYVPSDPSDLGRCLRLISIVPAIRNSVDSLAEKHPNWKKAAEVWDEITVSMTREVGIRWDKGHTAPETYELMKKAGL